jgi:hypothetical protein
LELSKKWLSYVNFLCIYEGKFCIHLFLSVVISGMWYHVFLWVVTIVPPKCTRLHGIPTQKTTVDIFTTVRTSNHTFVFLMPTFDVYLYLLQSIEWLRKWSQFGTAIKCHSFIKSEWLDAAHYQFTEQGDKFRWQQEYHQQPKCQAKRSYCCLLFW